MASRESLKYSILTFRISGGSERELSVVLIPLDLAVRASGLAGLGAVSKSLFNNALDGAGTPAASDAATQAAIDLPRIARQILRGADGTADIVVADDVAGTDNHGNRETLQS
jgi:hypothetical protein